MNERMPTIFVAHGAPSLLDDAEWVAELAAWAKAMPKPKSILIACGANTWSSQIKQPRGSRN